MLGQRHRHLYDNFYYLAVIIHVINGRVLMFVRVFRQNNDMRLWVVIIHIIPRRTTFPKW